MGGTPMIQGISLARKDLNLDKLIQSQLCYRYTTGQTTSGGNLIQLPRSFKHEPRSGRTKGPPSSVAQRGGPSIRPLRDSLLTSGSGDP